MFITAVLSIFLRKAWPSEFFKGLVVIVEVSTLKEAVVYRPLNCDPKAFRPPAEFAFDGSNSSRGPAPRFVGKANLLLAIISMHSLKKF